MMDPKRRRTAIGQYEPLVTPEKWSGDEKRFVLRLTQLLDELFTRQTAVSRRVSALEERLGKEENNG